jgi:hypothetical protein
LLDSRRAISFKEREVSAPSEEPGLSTGATSTPGEPDGAGVATSEPAASAWLRHYETVAQQQRHGARRRGRLRFGARRPHLDRLVIVGFAALLAVAVLVYLLASQP